MGGVTRPAGRLFLREHWGGSGRYLRDRRHHARTRRPNFLFFLSPARSALLGVSRTTFVLMVFAIAPVPRAHGFVAMRMLPGCNSAALMWTD
jgi:hypothetical protein